MKFNRDVTNNVESVEGKSRPSQGKTLSREGKVMRKIQRLQLYSQRLQSEKDSERERGEFAQI